MGLFTLPLLVSLAAPLNEALAAASRDSPRPIQCAVAPSVWARSRSPKLQRGCRLLAEGYSQLRLDATRSLALSRKSRVPGLASAALLLEARSLLREGDANRAHARFSELVQAAPLLLESTQVLRERAAAAKQAGADAVAVAAYRRLVPRVTFLPAPERAPALIEAAFSVAELGRPFWSEARALLVRAAAADGLRGDHHIAATGMRLLGAPGRRNAIDAQAVGRLLERPNRVWLAETSRVALLAAAAEAEGLEAASELWERYRRLANDRLFKSEAIQPGARP